METNQIRYRTGQQLTFLATKSFALGNTGYTIMEGQEVLFDGTNVEVGGNKFSLPSLRGAVRMGWLVPPEDYDAAMDNPRPAVAANIQVRSANDLGQNPMQPVRRAAIVTTATDEHVIMNRAARAEAAADQTHFVRGGRGMETHASSEGVPVARTLLTRARSETQVTPDTVGQAILAADKVKVQPGQGISEDEMLRRMSEEDRAKYVEEKALRREEVLSRTKDYSLPPAQTTNLAAYNNSTQVVARVPPQRAKVTETEGARVSFSVGGGTEIADFTGSSEKPPQESMVTAEGMTFRNTNGPKVAFQAQAQVEPKPQAAEPKPQAEESRIDKDGTAEARKQIAKTLCKDFPDEYSFADHWKRRLAMIRLHYEGRYDVIRAIFAAESDDFKRTLLEEFPEAFRS